MQVCTLKKGERGTWSEAEVRVYINCVNYISKVCIAFISKLPCFTPYALRFVISRQEEYYNSLCDILTDIHSMTKFIKSTNSTYREYERIYRENLIEKYKKVELIGAGLNNAKMVTRYDISSSYVELSCINKGVHRSEIELSQVFVNSNVVWIKGEAGSGKTTFLQWVAVCVAKNEYHKIDNIRNSVPIIIELRSIKWPINLLDAVNKNTLLYENGLNKWILDLLENGRAILLFDGLDEISQKKREKTYKFIESMVEQYPQIKILLTARNSVNDFIGCESIAYEILPMKIEKIKKFINYWHN